MQTFCTGEINTILSEDILSTTVLRMLMTTLSNMLLQNQSLINSTVLRFDDCDGHSI